MEGFRVIDSVLGDMVLPPPLPPPRTPPPPPTEGDIQEALRRRRSHVSRFGTTDLAPGAATAASAVPRGAAEGVAQATRGVVHQGDSMVRAWMAVAVNEARGLLGIDTDRDHPLIALVRHDPVAAARFIEVIMLLGAVLAAIATVTCSWLLATRWMSCDVHCDRPLRLWLLVHAVVQGVQVPIRLRFFAKLCRVRPLWISPGSSIPSAEDVERLETCVTVTGLWTWNLVRLISVITYGWLALGLIWVVNATSDGCQGGLRITCTAMMTLIGLRSLFVAELFKHVFGGSSTGGDQANQDGPCEPSLTATPSEVAGLTKTLYCDIKSTSMGSHHTSCVVCCSDFQDRDLCRILPCGHHFHQHCVDEWFLRSTRCPLCMGSIRKAKAPPS